MLDIFEHKDEEAIKYPNFREEVMAEINAILTAKVTAKLTAINRKSAIMLIKERKISLDEVSLFFPQFSEEDIETIKKEIEL